MKITEHDDINRIKKTNLHSYEEKNQTLKHAKLYEMK